ncbi:MAG: MBL fold metallo-hydrolase [Bacteriovoracaceae bacterium]|nr:MBL fold metallo-hydrolase [Bacteriovoracaceae bacterium]
MKNNCNEVVALGTGTSTGIPMIGCSCKVCCSDNPKNKRYRTSILLKTSSNKTILVDTTPDLRSQFLENNIVDCDACIITHEHADHVHGIDDLRPLTFAKQSPIPVYTYDLCADHLREKFPYIFKTKDHFKNKAVLGGGIPKLELHSIEQDSKILGEDFEFFLLPHGHTKTLSFIHKKFGFAVDCKTIPRPWIEKLKASKLDLFILDCVKRDPHQTHLHLDAALEIAKEVGAKRTGLIHMGHELEHEHMTQELNGLDFDVFPLYDRQILTYGE